MWSTTPEEYREFNGKSNVVWQKSLLCFYVFMFRRLEKASAVVITYLMSRTKICAIKLDLNRSVKSSEKAPDIKKDVCIALSILTGTFRLDYKGKSVRNA